MNVDILTHGFNIVKYHTYDFLQNISYTTVCKYRWTTYFPIVATITQTLIVIKLSYI